jgi:hypothetical protein
LSMPRLIHLVYFYRPPTNGLSRGSHYERLSHSSTLRLDRTLGPRPHRRHHPHRHVPWRWIVSGAVFAAAVALSFVGRH